MKQFATIFLATTLILAMNACTKKPKEEKSETTEEASEKKKDVSELTYFDIYKIALAADNGGGMDYHGDAFGTDALDQVTLVEGSPCGENDCGISMLLNNVSDMPVNAVIRANYDLPGNPNKEMVRAYVVPADTSINVGCSQLCWDGNGYAFNREIIQAGFANSSE